MRVYGRITNTDGSLSWQVVTTDANGQNDAVYITAMAQAIKLNLNESPFFATVGIPQQQTILTQVYPDFYVNNIQTLYAPYFAALSITRTPGSFPPAYKAKILTHSGAIVNVEIPT